MGKQLAISIENRRLKWAAYKEEMRNFENQYRRSYDVYEKMISDFCSLTLTKNEAPQYWFPVDVGESNLINVIDDVNDSVPPETLSSTLIQVDEISSIFELESLNEGNSLSAPESVPSLDTLKHALKLGELSAEELKIVNQFIPDTSPHIVKNGCDLVSNDSMTTL